MTKTRKKTVVVCSVCKNKRKDGVYIEPNDRGIDTPLDIIGVCKLCRDEDVQEVIREGTTLVELGVGSVRNIVQARSVVKREILNAVSLHYDKESGDIYYLRPNYRDIHSRNKYIIARYDSNKKKVYMYEKEDNRPS